MPKPREHIIPIQMEEDEENESEKVVTSVKNLSLTQHEETDDLEQEEGPIEREPIVVNENFEIPKQSLPICNAEEHILLVIDAAQDEHYTPFKLTNDKTITPLQMLIRGVEIFLYNKHSINTKHKYGIAVLDENSCSFLLDFTNNIEQVINVLNKITTCNTEDIFDLNTMFNVICEHVTIPTPSDLSLPPPYIVRTILLYGRSYTIPKLKKNDEITKLLTNPYFTLDILMTHEHVSSSNHCNKIFNVLQNLDTKGFAYFFSVARNMRVLHCSMAKLLSHPLQRPFQKFASYTLKNVNN